MLKALVEGDAPWGYKLLTMQPHSKPGKTDYFLQGWGQFKILEMKDIVCWIQK